MKVDAKIFKGIEYVVVSDLPQLQQRQLLDTINQDLFIKIMIDGKIVAQCLQYKDYLNWYERSSSDVTATVSVPEQRTERIKINAEFALNKA